MKLLRMWGADKERRFLPALHGRKLRAAQLRFDRHAPCARGGIGAAVFEEIGNVSAAFLGNCSQRWCDIYEVHDVPFGGLPMLLAGDSWQVRVRSGICLAVLGITPLAHSLARSLTYLLAH